MTRKATTYLLLLSAGSLRAAEAGPKTASEVPLWADGAPGSESMVSRKEVLKAPETPYESTKLSSIHNPSLLVYLPPKAKATGAAMIIAPGPAGFNVPRLFVASILYTLPLGKGRRFLNRGGIVDQALGGWQFSTITTVQDGTSITTRSWDSAGQTIVPDGNRLNCIAGVSQVASSPNPDLYYVPAAFANTTAGQFGNCGRNNLIAPSQWNVDFSLLKDFRLAERHSLQFCMEMFNAPNHPAWGRPSANWGNQNAIASTSFGRIRSTIQLRQIQFALKYYF